MSNIS